MLYIVYYTIVLHSVLDYPRCKFWCIFEHLVFSIWARPGRGLGLAASSSTSNRVVNFVNSTWFKYQKK